MKVKVDTFLKAENLGEATKKNPMEGQIIGVIFKEASELGFASKEGRYELKVMVNAEEYDWLANKTSLRAIIAAYGEESDAWVGQKIKLYPLEQNVSGEIKQVVYASV
jgi:hypothetical protein